MNRILFVLFIFILNSCSHNLKKNDGYMGWIKFHGEFMLYDNLKDFKNEKNGKCISGAFKLEKQKKFSEKYDGKKVRVYGDLVEWSLPDSLALSLNNQGSPIINRCSGKNVLFAKSIEVILN